MVVVIVEADFADGYNARISRQGRHQFVMTLFDQSSFVRMDANGRVNAGALGLGLSAFGIKLLGKLDRATDVVGAIAIADCEQGFDAGRPGAGDRRRTIVVESGTFEMAVTVNKHKSRSVADARR